MSDEQIKQRLERALNIIIRYLNGEIGYKDLLKIYGVKETVLNDTKTKKQEEFKKTADQIAELHKQFLIDNNTNSEK